MSKFQVSKYAIAKMEFFEFFEDSSNEQSLLMTSESSESSESSSSESDTNRSSSKHVKVSNFLQTITLYSEADFKSHFRLKRSTTLYLIALYKSHTAKVQLLGRPPLGADAEIYMYLWYIANTVTFRQLGNLFGVAKSTAWKSVNKVTKFLIEISPNYIKWPTSQQEITKTVEGFERLKGIPGIIAAIDGSHIQIKTPRQNAQDYRNRNKYCSINLQIAVDSEKKVLDVYCGEPGSIHDARVLRRSELFKRVVNNPEDFFPSGTFMIGDSAYPCKNWLIPPFKDNGALTNIQKKFNYIHSSTRVKVENALGQIKTRFRRILHFSEQSNIPLIVNLTYSACVLHNICIAERDEYIEITDNAIADDDPVPSSEIQCEHRREELMQELIRKNIL